MSAISESALQGFRGKVEGDPTHKILQNVLTNNSLKSVAINREAYQSYQHYYNVTTKPEVKVTNQKSSGRCWLFAALNVVRRNMMEKYNLDNFEFSQSYLFFWDKLERLNYGMDAIIKTKHLDLDSREVQHLLNDPTCDGGQWDMFCNLVEKYGLVPKSVYRETHHSSNSHEMNNVLKSKFRDYAKQLRESENPEDLKPAFQEEIFQILSKFLGTPPSRFTWDYKDKVLHKPESVKNVSPLEFYRHHVPWKSSDYVCVVNDPRNSYNNLYTVQFLGNVVEGTPIQYLNVDIAVLKRLALESLKKNKVVWFGCDVMKSFQGDECAMDLDLVDKSSIFGIENSLTKTERLNYGESLMTHAMVFTGARTNLEHNCVEGERDQEDVSHWQVENSWADKGPGKGFYNMSDRWFDEYVFEVAVERSLLTKQELEVLSSNQVTSLPPWDPMGALAV